MGQVIIGVDPHKLSATIEVVDQQEKRVGAGRFSTDQAGYAAMRKYAKSWPDRVWAVEGANGAGRPLAQRLLEAGEHVVDVPAKLAARVRLFDTGHNRKTDALDAHSIAIVAVRTEGLRVLKVDGELEALRMLADRREALTRRRVQSVNRLQALLAELLPGQGKKDITTGQTKALLASVRPRDIAGRTRRRIAAEELAELVAVEAKIKKATAELKAPVLERGSTLMDLHGVGPVVAARILADVGDIARFADRNRFASWTGTAPLDASSGEQNRHRLSRAGNRRMNHMIHIAAVTQLRLPTEGRAYYRRKRSEHKKPMEALRCLKRRISDAIYRQLVADAQRAAAARSEAGPGGHCGASLESSAVDLPPHIDTSDQPLPGPAPTTLPLTTPTAKPLPGPAPQPPQRRARAVKVQRPTGRTTLTATSAGAHSKEPIPTP
ncbi:IS110 family transposase [Ornithinimicrobium sp. F0845]|uniref:IS110 family transposase n=1 Tax=Ornithinimicrobium sp. F0845 TaxID=2926412 RepID=UPI001FF2D167|nr:IS110 family transposase [Ornithinimicrobium sp. F0845]MCK0112839.1 IS110 family transposase [Ornithinimicrobium sp. F0845]